MPEGFLWMEGTSAESWSFVDPEAIIGRAPEMDEWRPGDEYFKPIIHCAARIEPLVTIDSGRHGPTIIGNTYALKKSHMGHDCMVGDGTVISTGAIIGGHAVIEDGAKIGLGAIVLPYRRVGKNAVVGAGAVVTRDVEDGDTVAGNPARSISPNSVAYTERLR